MSVGLAGKDAGQLRLRFRRANTLPFLPDTAKQIIAFIDQGQTSTAKIATILARDPAFVAEFCRYASLSLGKDTLDLNLTAMVSQLGTRAVRTLAMAIAAKNVLPPGAAFDKDSLERLARAAVATGYFSKYLLARWLKTHTDYVNTTPEEIFTVGLISKIGVGILAIVAPECYTRSLMFANKTGRTISECVQELYDESINELLCDALQSWNLPPEVVRILRNVPEPWNDSDVLVPSACVQCAKVLTARSGLTFEVWAGEPDIPPDIQHEVGITDEEFAQVKDHIVKISTAVVSGRATVSL